MKKWFGHVSRRMNLEPLLKLDGFVLLRYNLCISSSRMRGRQQGVPISGCSCSLLRIFLWWLAGAWDSSHLFLRKRLWTTWTSAPSLWTRRTVDTRGHPFLRWVLLIFLLTFLCCRLYRRSGPFRRISIMSATPHCRRQSVSNIDEEDARIVGWGRYWHHLPWNYV
jgi:hypothetical protein